MLKGYRTLLFSVIVAVIGVLEGFEWANIIPDNIEAFVLPVVAAIFAWLRKLTNTAVGQAV